MLHNFMMAARENGVTMDRFRRDGKAIAESFIRAIETYRYDGVLVDIDTTLLAGAVGVPVDFPADQPARCHEALLHSLEEVSKLEPVDIPNYFSIQAALEAVSLLKGYFKDEIAVRGNCDQAPFSLACLIRGMEDWLIDVLEADAALIHGLLEFGLSVNYEFLRLMAEAGADILSNGDSPAGPDVVSPAIYQQFAEPYEERIVGRAHEYGLPYILHICGNTNRILTRMLATGADGFELDYKTDMKLAHDLLSGRAVFIGNVDPSGVLAFGTPERVEQKTKELLQVFSDTPRFILNAGCAIPAETPPENLRAMINTARNFR
jgi:uroporphyrinogen decarboxylase